MTVTQSRTSPEQRHREALARRLPMVCGLKHLGRCRGRLHDDHVIEKQTLKRVRREAVLRVKLGKAPLPRDEALLAHSEDELIADDRNGWWLCDLDHSAKWLTDIDPDWLPTEVDEFAQEFGLQFHVEQLRKPAS